VVEALKGAACGRTGTIVILREINTYSYTDETGSLLYQIVKSERYVNGERKKKFAQRYPPRPAGGFGRNIRVKFCIGFPRSWKLQ